jgi:hypothetical protein
MLGRDPVSISCQDSWQQIDDEAEQSDLNKRISVNVALIRDDVVRIGSALNQNQPVTVTSGSQRAICPQSGVCTITLLTDTATAGSTGVNYHTFQAFRNGLAISGGQFTVVTAASREVAAYGTGTFIGQLPLAENDVISLSVVVTGAPAPALTVANLMVRLSLQES